MAERKNKARDPSTPPANPYTKSAGTPATKENTAANDSTPSSDKKPPPPHSPSSSLTEAQKERMEENRRQALERRRAQSDTKDTFSADRKPPPAAQSPSSLTKDQKERMEQNRKHALALKTESERKKRLAAACGRCGENASKGTLCIVWRHRGEIQRERSFHGDIFRYSCCGRLDPQPCFVGKHLQPGEHVNPNLVTVLNCDCGKLAQLRRTHKQGLNTGRYFYRCCTVGRPDCDFFQWADQVHGLPPFRPVAAPDGIQEWMYPHANPFGEDLAHHNAIVHADQARKRVIGALLIKAMVHEVTGAFVCLSVQPESIFENVKSIVSEKTIVKKMYPLTLPQVEQRFGCDLDNFCVPDDAECDSILQQVLDLNPIMRSTVHLETLTSGMHQGKRLLSLQGLESYFAI